MTARETFLLFPPTHPLPYPHLAIPALVSYLHRHAYENVAQLDLSRRYTMTGKTPKHDVLQRHSTPEDRSLLSDQNLLQSHRAARKGDPSTLREFIQSVAQDPRTRLVGLSLVYPQQMNVALAIARDIKRARPDLTVVAGGPLVTIAVVDGKSHYALRDFDALIAGDGEAALLAIAQQLSSGPVDFSTVPNCHFMRDGRYVFSGQTFVMHPRDYTTPVFQDASFETAPLRMSKGCYWRRCVFCSYKTLFDGYLAPDVPNTLQQVKDLNETGARHFIFVDDAIPATVLLQFAKALIGAGVKVAWDCSAIFDARFGDPDVAAVLAAAGCGTIYFGFESANERVLELMGKANKLPDVRRILAALTRSGICCHLNVMVGFPTESMEEAQETIDFLKRHRGMYGNYSLQRFSLEKMTDVFEHPERFGITEICEKADENVSARIGVQFQTASGMNAEQRHYMALKGWAAYKKDDTRTWQYLRRRLECFEYLLLNHRQIVMRSAGSGAVGLLRGLREALR